MMVWQFAVFVGVGVLSACVDIGVLQLLVLGGWATGFSVSCGFAAGLLVNYWCHARLTFRVSMTSRSMLRFGVVVGLNYLITLSCVLGAERAEIGVLLGKVVSLPIVALNGFAFSKYWVFKR